MAAPYGAPRAALKDAVLQILSCALQPHSNIQRLTEERRKAFEMIEDYAFILVDIVESQEEAFAERLMAATFLKNYIHDIYTRDQVYPLNLHLKRKLTIQLIELVVHPNDAIRKMFALTLETLLVHEYHNLFEIINSRIMHYLLSEQTRQVWGALEFMRGLTRNQPDFCRTHLYFPPEYVEPLLNVLYCDNLSMILRSAAVSCMMQILVTSRATPFFEPTKARVNEVFQKMLTEPYTRIHDYPIRTEIITQISSAVDILENDVIDMVSACMPAIGQIMYGCCETYKTIVVTEKSQGSLPPMYHGDMMPESFRHLILSILTLINKIYTNGNYTALFANCLNDFMFLLFILMCTYDGGEDGLFLEEELDQSPEIDFSIRGRCSHTIMVFILAYYRVFMDQSDYELFCASFHHVIQRHIDESELNIASFNVYNYRLLESLMYGIGLLNLVYDPNPSFVFYIENWTTIFLDPVHSTPPHWIVLARILWLGSKYSTFLRPDTLNHHLNAILVNGGLVHKPLRLACLDALRVHLSSLTENTPNRHIFIELMPQIVECVFAIPTFTTPMTVIALQSLGSLFHYFPEIASRNAARVFQTILESLMAHISNPLIVKEVKFILSRIVLIPSCKDIVKTGFIPFTMKLIYKTNLTPLLNIKFDVSERGFDLLNTVIKYYPDPLENDIIIQSFTAACDSVYEDQDSSVREVATIFISNLLMKASFQIKALRDIKGKCLAEYVPTVIFRLLEPQPEDAVCPSKFGRLCVISIMTLTENIQPSIEAILKALLSALQRTNNQNTLKGYSFIFAYLFTWQTDCIMNFLSGIPGPDGRSALNYFLNKWQIINLRNTEKFEKSTLVLAVCKLIEFSLTTEDDRINSCIIMLEAPYNNKCTGLEKLYLFLIQIFLNELASPDDVDVDRSNNDDILIGNHPFCSINIVEHIKGFIRNFNTYHYYNIVKKYVQTCDSSFFQLTKHGIKPNNM